MKKIILWLLDIYHRFFSAWLKTLFSGSGCRFTPSCSVYCSQAIERYGILKGFYLGGKRILRCHPWSKGGVDPVPRK